MDLNNIRSNVLIHAGGKSASHRFVDLLMLNNPNLTVEVPDKNIPLLEPHYVEHWKQNPASMEADLTSITQQGKHWVMKTGGVPDFAFTMSEAYTNTIEIGLVRENVSDHVASYVLALLNDAVFHIHTTEQTQQIADREDEFINMLHDTHNMQKILERGFQYTAYYTMNVLTLGQTRNFPVYTYDQISLNPESLFDYCGNYTVMLDQSTMSKPIPRLKTPHLPEFRQSLNPLLAEVIKPELIESLNQLAPSGITFVR